MNSTTTTTTTPTSIDCYPLSSCSGKVRERRTESNKIMGSRGDSFDPFWRDRSHENIVKLSKVTSSEKPFSDAFQWPEDTVWNVDEADPWTPSPPHMVDTSMESDTDRVNLSFSSELGSLFPKLGIQGSPDRSKKASVAIVMQERLSILFDGMTPEPSCRVVGKILVRSRTVKYCFGYFILWDVSWE